jgi:CRISPR-associated protein Cas1
MKHLLNTLYVTTQGCYLAREGDSVVVRLGDDVKARLPLHVLGSIVCFGQVSCSHPLLGLCAERGVAVSLLSERGRFWARIEGPVSGNVLLRREQFRAADDEERATAIARNMVAAKLANSRMVLLRAARESGAEEPRAGVLAGAARAAGILLEAAQRETRRESLRGLEGEGAAVYFGVFDELLTAGKPEFAFHGRSRRPPLDRVNALLSFLYTLLAHDCAAAASGTGLDPAVGFLHVDRPGRAGLALDLMEEFRAALADRLALALINRRQVKADGFEITGSGAVEMNEPTRKEVLAAWQRRKQEEVLHPFLNERIAMGLVPHVQAMLLARHLRGELDAYPPMLWK